jgi:hypothetical protein
MLLGASAGAAAERRPITAANHIVAAYEEDWGLKAAGAPKLIVGVWADGHVVWSQDQVHGGPPYYVGTIDLTRVDSFFAWLAADGVLEDTMLNDARFGPDSTFTTLLVRDRAAVQRLLPGQGQPVGGIILVEGGTFSWAEELRN